MTQSTSKLKKQVTQLINQLDSFELECIYLAGARLWLDTGDRSSLSITYVPPPGRAMDEEMDDDPSVGSWVWTDLNFRTVEGTFPNSDGHEIGFGCPGLADWTRQFLLRSAKAIADGLEHAAEMTFHRQCLERMSRWALVQAVKCGRAMRH
ncbi:hypothetical protein ACG02S_16505 [Roseateles sp. DC23W]|uniref:Uncharacterized protein n=1 Tax=Pelomonas dachongensis TaxID=3299029 RepID=A0ABW7EPT9_9BURK